MFMGPSTVLVTAYPGLFVMSAWISASLETLTRIPDRAKDAGAAFAGGADPGQVEQAMGHSLEGANRDTRHVKRKGCSGDKKSRAHAYSAEL
jgi:hypothetical protein